MLLKIDRYEYINKSVTSVLSDREYIDLLNSALLHKDNIIELKVNFDKYKIYYIMLSSAYKRIKDNKEELNLIENAIINMFREIY